MLGMGVTELETDLETLFGRALLLQPAGGGIAMPVELALSARAKAARINGLKGGRPRKDGQPPGQRSMLMPIAGGASEKPNVTEPVTQAETHLAGATTTTADSGSDLTESESSGSSSGAASPWVSLACELAGLAGLKRSVTAFELTLVKGWLEAGASAETLRSAFRVVLGRDSCPAEPALKVLRLGGAQGAGNRLATD